MGQSKKDDKDLNKNTCVFILIQYSKLLRDIVRQKSRHLKSELLDRKQMERLK